ncbi:flippase-like domain-containing protein [bacterium]|nr:flippase-like domain-containing protein [bacterium]
MSVAAKLRNKLLAGLAVGALVYIGVVIYSGWSDVRAALAQFPWAYLPLILGLSLLNYLFRFGKWSYYLRVMNINVRTGDSFVVFMSGLVMVISPGKIGELVKSVFLRQASRVPMARTMPIVFAERLTDFIALVIISFAGFGVLATGDYVILLVVAAMLVGTVLVIGHRPTSMFFIGLVERLPVARRVGHKLHTMYDSMSTLVRLTPLVVATLWSILAWLCECVGLWIVAHLLGSSIDVLAASFIYAFGTIVGAVAPGGLGVTDGTLIAMLQSNAVTGGAALSKAGASAATMIIRMATLWFAVLVGAGVLLAFQSRFAGAERVLDDAEAAAERENAAGLPDK